MKKIKITNQSKLNLFELYQYKYSLVALLKQSIFLPYNDSKFVFFLTFCRPLLFLVIFITFKDSLQNLVSSEGSYTIYIFIGLIIWWFIVDSVKQSALSFKHYRNILLKIYLPKFIIPVIPIFARLFDLFLHFIALFFFIFLFNESISFNIYIFLLSLINLIAICVSLGTLLSIISLKINFFNNFIDYLFFISFFITPVIFSLDKVPEKFNVFYKYINPFISPLYNLRASIIPGLKPDIELLFYSLFFSLLVTFFTLVFFTKFINASIEKL